MGIYWRVVFRIFYNDINLISSEMYIFFVSLSEIGFADYEISDKSDMIFAKIHHSGIAESGS